MLTTKLNDKSKQEEKFNSIMISRNRNKKFRFLSRILFLQNKVAVVVVINFFIAVPKYYI